MEDKTKSDQKFSDAEVENESEEKNESKETIEIIDKDTSETDQSSEHLDEVEQLVTKLKQEKSKIEEKLLRTHAEFDNYKKRTVKEKAAERKYKSQDLATELLPVLDNFERALQTEVSSENKSFKDGMQMIYEQLETALKSHGIEPIEAVNEPFDPNYHHAVMQIEDENFEANIVVEQFQKGYVLNDKVIRPAMVKVNK